MFNPNCLYISVQSERGYITHNTQLKQGKYGLYGPQALINTTTVATAVQRRWTHHTRTVLPAGAYGRQRRSSVFSACSIVCLVYVLMRGLKTDKLLPVGQG